MNFITIPFGLGLEKIARALENSFVNRLAEATLTA